MVLQSPRCCCRGLRAIPIDLIPDFIPVLGYLDDLLIVPLGIALVLRLMPPEVIKECRVRATASQSTPVSRAGASVVVLLWFVAVGFAGPLACPILGLIGAQVAVAYAGLPF